MPQYPARYSPSDAQAGLTQYAMDMADAFAGAPMPWASMLGLLVQTNAQVVKVPVPLYSLEFEAFKNESKFESLSTKTISVEKQKYQKGIHISASELDGGDYTGWTIAPQVMAAIAAELPNKWVADALEANAACDYDGVSFFATTHKVNPFNGSSTFSNLHATTALTLANFQAARGYFGGMKGPDGKRGLGLKLTGLIVPPELEQTALEIRNSSLIYNGSAAVANPALGSFEVFVEPRLTSATTWYAVSGNAPGVKPWVVVTPPGGMPSVRVLGQDSDLYKSEDKYGLNMIMSGAAELVLPHALHKFTA